MSAFALDFTKEFTMLKNLLKNLNYPDLADGMNEGAKFKWESKRTGVGQEVSELAMSKDAKSKLRLSTLLKVSKNSEAKRKMRNFEEKAVIEAPLKKPLAQKAARRVNFEEVSTEIAKYDPIVKELRSADQVIFPRNDDDGGSLRLTVAGQFGSSAAVGVQTSEDLKKKKVSSLEKEITEQLVLNEENVELDSRPLTENELAILKSKSVEEARALHREIQRRRLLTSYQEAKFRRLRRIKSKKYHRILKKEKLKATVAELDQLLETGEEGAEEKLAELDRLRALERASLKHHATGKWAKYNKLRSKYDDAARAQLNEQMALNAELMKRRSLAVLEELKKGDDGSEDEEVDRLIFSRGGGESKKVVEGGENDLPISIPTDYNPWISKVPKVSTAVAAKKPSILTKDNDNSTEHFFAKRVKARMQAQEEEDRREARRQDARDEEEILVESTSFSSLPARAPDGDEITTTIIKNLKLDSLIVSAEDMKTKKGKLVNNIPEEGDRDDPEGDDEVGGQTMGDFDFSGADMQQYLREAFIDDDVVADFLREKKEASKAEQEEKNPQNPSAYLPGWGNWAGGGIAENRRKRARLMKRTVRREHRIGAAIANAIVLKDETVDEVARKYKIAFKPNSVPNVAAFQAALAKPVGAIWNPQSVFKSMTAPKVLTKAGTIIRPMTPAASTEQTLLKGASSLKGRQQQKQKNQNSQRKALR